MGICLATNAGVQAMQRVSVAFRTFTMSSTLFGPGQPGLRGAQPVGKLGKAANASPPPAAGVGAKATDHCLRAFLRCMIAAQAGALQQLRERARFTLQCRHDSAGSATVPAAAAAPPATPSEGAGTGLMTLSHMSYDDSPPWSTDLPQLDELSVNRMVAVSHNQRDPESDVTRA